MKKFLLYLSLLALVPRLARAQEAKTVVGAARKITVQPLSKQRKLDLLFLSAVKKGNTTAAKTFLSKGAGVHAKNENGNSALYLAAAIGKTDLIQFLLKKGAKVNQRNMDGRMALGEAIGSRQSSAVKLLLDNGAEVNVNSSDRSGMSMLTLAVYLEALFINMTAEMKKSASKETNNFKPDRNLTTIKLLLKSGAKVDATALAIAKNLKATSNIESIEKLLLQAQVEQQNTKPSLP